MEPSAARLRQGNPPQDGDGTAELARHERLAASAKRLEFGAAGERRVWREWGAGSAVVLLHGGYGSWTHWTRNIAALASSRRVLVPDTPGFGESDLPAVPDTAYVADSLWADLDTLTGGAAVDLVGFSYGGRLGADMASARPHRVARFVLVGSGGLGLQKGPREDLVRWRGLDAAGQRAAHRRNLEILMFARPETADELALRLQAENAGRAALSPKKMRSRSTVPQALSGKGVALAGIWGERDFTLGGQPVTSREEVIRGLDPAAEWVVLGETGHWAQYESAEAFNAALLAILDRRRPWGRGAPEDAEPAT